jgi:type VI secretion system protein ImpE
MTADQLLRDGDLDGARAALVEIVRARPADVEARMFLFQLLALLGEWDKARTQVNALASMSPEAQMLGAAYGAAIEAEKLRADVFAGRAAPPVLTRNSPWAHDLAEALGHFSAGRAAEGMAARARAFDAAPDTPGTFDGTPFEWIADADSRFGPAFEVIIAGQWGLMPFDAVQSITSEGARDLRDIIWYPVQLGLRTGQSVAAMMPARYPGSEADEAGAIRLGKRTEWREAPWGDSGIGQHLLQLSDGDERDLLSLRSLVFE